MAKRTKSKSMRAGFVLKAWVEIDIPADSSTSLEDALSWAKTVDLEDLLGAEVTHNDGTIRVVTVFDEIGELEA